MFETLAVLLEETECGPSFSGDLCVTSQSQQTQEQIRKGNGASHTRTKSTDLVLKVWDNNSSNVLDSNLKKMQGEGHQKKNSNVKIEKERNRKWHAEEINSILKGFLAPEGQSIHHLWTCIHQ